MSYLFLLKGDNAGSRDTHNPSTMMQEGSEDTMRFGLKQQKKNLTIRKIKQIKGVFELFKIFKQTKGIFLPKHLLNLT